MWLNFSKTGKIQLEGDSTFQHLALGAANIASAFSGGFPVTGDFSRSVVNFDAGSDADPGPGYDPACTGNFARMRNFGCRAGAHEREKAQLAQARGHAEAPVVRKSRSRRSDIFILQKLISPLSHEGRWLHQGEPRCDPRHPLPPPPSSC
ncbi:MAG: SulP family inorganic anion transporter [Rhodovibrio sp.]|nr:SulP family inorganic anion transporter [Rhodovibrio sp.]